MARNYDTDPLTNDDLEDIENFFKAVEEAYDELQESLNFVWEVKKRSSLTTGYSFFSREKRAL